jgi:YD repeat-containing protein
MELGTVRNEIKARRIALTAIALFTLTLAGPLLAQNTFRYSYDDLGQLASIIDQDGNVVSYTYDAASNMLQVSQSTLSSTTGVAIFNFTPKQGAIDSTVTIQGQSFSTTASADTVQFNGITAVVSAATATTLTVTVPSGATTGPISVKVGSATATTTNNFTVLPTPVITSVSPSSTTQGATITTCQVTGVNLTGSTFSFVPAFVPAAIAVSNAVINSGGTAATMTLTLASTAMGSFTLVATATAGSSSQIPGPNNTFSVLSTNPSADMDGDGLSNLYEEAIGSNPMQASTTNDGLPDGWALFYGLSPLDAGGGSQTAPDGLTYLQAYQSGLNPLVPTQVAPTVASVFPANSATNYPTNGVIVVRFSEPLQMAVTLTAAQNAINAGLPSGSTFSAANATTAAQVLQAYLLRTCCGGTAAVPSSVQLFQGTLALGGTITLSSDGLSLVFTPTQPLSSSTTYTVIAQGAKASSGVSMTQVFQSTFTTGLTTTSTTGSATLTSPPSGATNVPTNAAFSVQFSQQVDPATVTPQTFYLIDALTGQTPPGMLQVDASGLTASFVPQTPYNVGHLYYVFLTSGILDLNQNSFPGAGFSFTTGFGPQTQGPQLLGVSPANSATAVPLNSLVVAQFNEPISVISATNGLQVQQDGVAIPGAVALSNGNTQIAFTPQPAMLPSTTYTIAFTTQLTDVADNPLMNPGTFTFTTGAAADATIPSVVASSPANGDTGAPTNSVIRLKFSKIIDPLTVTTSDFLVIPVGTEIPMAGTITATTDGLTATFTPSAPLLPSTDYEIQVTGGMMDLEGHALSPAGVLAEFTTGSATAKTAPTVVQVSPPSGTTGTPVNTQVVAVMSVPVSAPSVGSSAITVSAGGTPVSGTVTLSGDQTTLTFVPGSLLATSTVYTVNVSGFTDQAGNTVKTFTSKFTTGTSGVPNTTAATVTATSPVNDATGVPVSSTIVLTFNEPIDAATVNLNTVVVLGFGLSAQLAGTYAVDSTGKVVTFTPLSPLPGNMGIDVDLGGVLDLSGNATSGFVLAFTTGAETDTTPPTVLNVTPGNGATGVGLNASVVLTFSKSMSRTTMNANTLALLVDGRPLPTAIYYSADNQVVTLYTGTLPASSTVTVLATTGVTDLVGNALANFESTFTTAAAFDTTHPAVVEQRPGNGATGVPLNTSVVLYVNAAMNVSTVEGALHVSQNGVLANGTTQVTDNGQVIQFAPSTPWTNGALIQVFLDATAEDVNGNALTAYEGSFTTVANTSTIAPSVQSASPASGATGVSTKLVIDIGFNEALNSATVSTTTVTLNPSSGGSAVAATVSLVGAGSIIQVVPSAALAASTQYYVQLTTGIQGTNGLALANTQNIPSFTTGTGADTTAPTVSSISPPNGSTNVGDNAQVVVLFSKPINPVTVSGSSIQLTGGGTTEVPDSISFSNNNQNVLLVPHAPLPDNTLMTLTISGVTDVAGNAVTTQATTFTTGTGPDLVSPQVVSTSPFSTATNVPLNAPIMLLVSEPVDPSTVNSNTFTIEDTMTQQYLAGSYSVSTDGRTITFLPSVPLGVDRTFFVNFGNLGITDLAGNGLSNTFCAVLCSFTFTTGSTANTTGPTVLGMSPANGLTGVPINTQVVVQFSEPVDGLTINQVTLSSGGTVNVTSTLTDANQTLILEPVELLNVNATYTISVTGVKDLSGNALTATSTTTFTTGAAADLVPPTVESVSPANGDTGAPTNGVIQLKFSKRIDPLTVTTSDFNVYVVQDYVTPIIAGTITVTPDGLTATFTPSSPLLPSTNYEINATSGITDLVAGEGLATFFAAFTTGSGKVTTAPTVVQVSPPNGTAGTPVNTQVVAVVSAPVSAVSVGSSAITVSAGSTPVSGAISLSSNQTTLTYTPGTLLATSTVYTVKVSGFTDQAGNTVVPLTSTFTTGTSGVANTTQPTVTAMSPAAGATGVSVSSTIALTFNEPIDAATVNLTTMVVSDPSIGEQLAGSYAVNAAGTVVTFTPLSPLPENATIEVSVNGVLDLSGNTNIAYQQTFTTGTGTDTTAPTVLNVTPGNGATGVGLNAAVVLTFSKSLNRSTVNGNTVVLLVDGSKLGILTSFSADNRTVTLSTSTLPASSTVAVVATTGVTDLWGNALVSFESTFTTAAAFDTTHPAVVGQRPGNGASGVPLNTSVVLYVNAAMNVSTVESALQVSQNGVLASGTTQVTDSGQVIQFTPSTPWSNGALIQVFLDATAEDVNGNALTAYEGSFTTVANTSTIAPSVQSVSPVNGATAVSTKLVIDIGFNEAINPATVNSTTVTLNANSGGSAVAATVSLVGGNIIQVVPSAALAASTSYYVQLTTGIQGTNGLALANTQNITSFTTGTGADTTAPAVLSVSPPNGSTNVGDNAQVVVLFSKPVNPLTVSGSSIQITGGGITEVPDAISFSNNNQNVLLVPHTPMPDNTVMTLTISGVTDVAGNVVKAQTTTFTTGTSPDLVSPQVVSTNPFSAATNVPLNALIMLLVSEPVDPSTVNSVTLAVSNATLGTQIAGTYSVSTDGRTISFLPSAPLAASDTFSVVFGNVGIADLSGNLLGCTALCNFYFTSGTASNTTGPTVLGVSPANGLTAVPINAQVVVQFSEPVDALTVSQVTLSGGGTVNVTSTLTNANQTLTLIPVAPLNASTTYTISVTGVKDMSGNALTAPSTTTFTTGTGADLTLPSVATVSPASGATSVPTSNVIELTFSKRIDPLTLMTGHFLVEPSATGIPIAGTITVTGDGVTATFTPSSPLLASTTYLIEATGGITDLEGHELSGSATSFTTE